MKLPTLKNWMKNMMLRPRSSAILPSSTGDQTHLPQQTTTAIPPTQLQRGHYQFTPNPRPNLEARVVELERRLRECEDIIRYFEHVRHQEVNR